MFDMTEDDICLDWFTPGDPDFYYDEESGYDVAIHTVTSIDQSRNVSPFVIMMHDGYYRVGQLYDFHHDPQTDIYESHELRHPSLIKQDYKLPHNVPIDGSFLGPMHAVNLTRIMRIVQAALSNETEVRDDATIALKQYYEEKADTKQQTRPVLRVLSFG